MKIKDISDKEEKILGKIIDILYNLRENKIEKTNESINELKSIKP